MPRPYHHDDEDETFREILGRFADRIDQPGGARGTGPDWPPAPEPPPGPPTKLGKLLLQIVTVVVVLIASALGLKVSRGDHPQPLPSRTLFAQRTVRVHSQPFRDSAVVRMLKVGERILATDRDGRGWTRVIEPDGHPVGYLYENAGNVLPTAPVVPRSEPISPPVMEAPADTTAICKDGSADFSATAASACVGHGGVDEWIDHPDR